MNRRQAISLVSLAGASSIMGFTETTDRNHYSKNNSVSNMKTIGILGGFGPQATMDFEKRLHNVAQQHIAADINSGYPTMIVHYHRHPPICLSDEQKPIFPLRPDPRLLESARRIGAMVDFLLIPSNGIHAMQKEIEQAANRRILSMIDVTLEEIKRKKWKKVGVMCFMNNNVYSNPLREMGISCEIIDDRIQQNLDRAIMKLMEGRETDIDKETAREAVNSLRSKNVDGIIPGCTEIPLLLGKQMEEPDLINPAQLLAEAAIRYSIS